MKNRLFIISTGYTIAMILILSGTGLKAEGPGYYTGMIDDNWYLSSWSCVYTHNDEDTETWCTGVSLWNTMYLDFGANPPDDYNYYLQELTVAWIAIDFTNNDRIIYEHDDVSGNGGSMDNHLMQSSYTFQQQNPPTTLIVTYDLDVNGDDTVDFQFDEKIVAKQAVPNVLGEIEIKIQPTPQGAWPEDDTVEIDGNNETIESIEYAFLCDPRVYQNPDPENDLYINNGGWSQLGTEGQFTPSADQNQNNIFAYFASVYFDRDLGVRFLQNNNMGNPTKDGYGLLHSGGQYSQYPSDYDNDEDIDGQDNLVWIVLQYDYSVAPVPQGNNWAGISLIYFAA